VKLVVTNDIKISQLQSMFTAKPTNHKTASTKNYKRIVVLPIEIPVPERIKDHFRPNGGFNVNL
jgi:hypothetical protein